MNQNETELDNYIDNSENDLSIKWVPTNQWRSKSLLSSSSYLKTDKRIQKQIEINKNLLGLSIVPQKKINNFYKKNKNNHNNKKIKRNLNIKKIHNINLNIPMIENNDIKINQEDISLFYLNKDIDDHTSNIIE